MKAYEQPNLYERTPLQRPLFKPALNWKIILICLWMASTLSLVGWWLYLMQRTPDTMTNLSRHRQMLLGEGLSWMVLLVGGGATLLWLVLREERQSRLLKQFFAAFTHDLKTSIASVRLQAESLKEDKGNFTEVVLDRLIADSVRLELQLENSLFLSPTASTKLFIEKIQFRELVNHLSQQWPATSITVDQDCELMGDERAMRSLFSNLIQNAIVHGKATEVRIHPRVEGSRIRCEVRDNGVGFHGQLDSLGRPYFRHGPTSGSGLGLFIAKTLATKMAGDMSFSIDQSKLRVNVDMPGRLL
jgi:signal transduction histidine kinase